VHQAGDESLEELALAEHDDRLVPEPLRQVVAARKRRTEPDEADEQERPAGGQRQRRGRDRRQGERGQSDGYRPLAFRISAEIAGTTSCRSPMTA
jgi:hypothetical protein